MEYVADNQFLKLFPGPIKVRQDFYKLSLAILRDCNFTHFSPFLPRFKQDHKQVVVHSIVYC